MTADISSWILPKLNVIEQYVLSDDPQAYITSLKDPQEKDLLRLLSSPYDKAKQSAYDNLDFPCSVTQMLMNRANEELIENDKSSYDQVMAVLRQAHVSEYFDYQRPHQIQRNVDGAKSDAESDQTNNASSFQLQNNLVDMLVQKLNQNPEQFFSKLSDWAICQIPVDKMISMPIQVLKKVIQKTTLIKYYKHYVTICLHSLKQAYKYSNNNRDPTNAQIALHFPTQILSCFNKTQLQELKQKLPQISSMNSFVGLYIIHFLCEDLHKFNNSLTSPLLSYSKKQQKRELLLKLVQKIDKMEAPIARIYSRSYFIQIIELQIQLAIPKMDHFIRFVNSLKTVPGQINQTFRSLLSSIQSQTVNYGNTEFMLQNRQGEQQQQSILVKYIDLLLSIDENSNKIAKQIAVYIDSTFIAKRQILVKLSRGLPVTNAAQFIDKDELQQLKEKKLLTILNDQSSDIFRINDDIRIKIKVKNIKQITVSIFECDTQKQYLCGGKTFSINTNTLSLTPNISYVYQIDEDNPFKEQQHNLLLDKLPKIGGVYIVDFEGNGVKSRALICRGKICVAERLNQAGKQLTFFDQNGEIIEDVKIWIDNRQLTAPKGILTIPYGKDSALNYAIFIVKDKLSLQYQLEVPRQSYEFNCKYLYNHQSFIVGNKAKIIIHPELYLYGKRISLDLIKRGKTIVSTQNASGIKSSQMYTNLQFKDNEDLIVDVLIASYTRLISIQVTGQIDKLCGDIDSLRSCHNVSISIANQQIKNGDIYLQKCDKRGYIIKTLGLTGQPLQNQSVKIKLRPQGTTYAYHKTTKTNKTGEVVLGALNTIDHVFASFKNNNNQQVIRSWLIKSSAVQYLPSVLYHCAGDKIQLYYPGKLEDLFLNSQQFSHRGGILNIDLSQELKLQNTHLTIKNDNLPCGQYTLAHLPTNKIVTINIFNARHLPNDLIRNNHNGSIQIIQKRANLNDRLQFKSHTVQQLQQNNKVTISIPKNNNDTMRIHVLGLNYLDAQRINKFDIAGLNINEIYQKFSDKQNRLTCAYTSDGTLSDQHAYVLNRQKQPKTIGSNIDRPGLFIKRQFVRQTHTEDEKLKIQTAMKSMPQQSYDNFGLFSQQQQNVMSYNAMPAGLYAPMPTGTSFGGYQNQSRRMYSMSSAVNHVEAQDVYEVAVSSYSSHNSFLTNSGFCLSNLQPNADGNLTFEIPNNYVAAQITVLTSNSADRITITLPHKNIKNKDLRHNGLKQCKQGNAWTMRREIYTLHDGSKLSLNRDSTWCVFGAANFIAYAQIVGCTLQEWASNWHTYSESKKIQMYNKYYGHQLHIYLHQKDPQFFLKHVKPYISCKLVRTFIDKCLLDDPSVLQYKDKLEKLKNLSQIQKILLIQQLVKYSMKKDAQVVANLIASEFNDVKPNMTAFKNQFDTVINSKIIESEENYDMGANFDDYCGDENDESYSANPFNNNYNRSRNIVPQMCNFAAQDMMVQECRMQCSVKEAEPSIRRSIAMKKKAAPILQRKKVKKGFEELQVTKQFAQTTFYKSYSQNVYLMNSKFWSDLAIALSTDQNKPFIAQSLLQVKQIVSSHLALAFLPSPAKPKFEIQAKQGSTIDLQAKSTFLAFVKQVKPEPINLNKTTLINQRFFKPNWRNLGENLQVKGTNFLPNTVYILLTVVTNIYQKPIEVQLLVDIPQGSIPLKQCDNTHITNLKITPFSTLSVQRYFYFPTLGDYTLYPANASSNAGVIAIAEKFDKLHVMKTLPVRKAETTAEILTSGTSQQVLKWLETGNLNTPALENILWMLKNKEFYDKCMNILRNRKHYLDLFWRFSILHKDIPAMKEYYKVVCNQQSLVPPIFEYFPYIASRVHKFMNQKKSNIRNQQFKNTYIDFVVQLTMNLSLRNNQSYKLVHVYYLLLQDKITEAFSLYGKLNQSTKRLHAVQCDYLECYFQMLSGRKQLNKVKDIVSKHINCQQKLWKKLFSDLNSTIVQFEKTDTIQNETGTQQAVADQDANIINHGDKIGIMVPAATKLQVYVYEINLQVSFSLSPFVQITDVQSFKPSKIIDFTYGTSRQQTIQRHSLKVQTGRQLLLVFYQTKKGGITRKLKTQLWKNPQLKIRVNEKQGTIQVFQGQKRGVGCYVKVFSDGNKGVKLYRDGYTDLIGVFRYALAGLKDISKFSILIVGTCGSQVVKVDKPVKSAYYQGEQQ